MSFCRFVLARSRVIQLLTSPKCYVFPQVWALLRHMALMRCSLGVGLKAQQPTALPPAISLRRLRAEINIYTLYIYVYIATRWMWRYERVVWRKHIDKYALRLRREEMSRICVSFPKLSYTFMVNPIRPVYSCEYKPIAFLLPFWSISCHRVIVSSSHLSLLFHGSFLHFCGQTKHFDILCTVEATHRMTVLLDLQGQSLNLW